MDPTDPYFETSCTISTAKWSIVSRAQPVFPFPLCIALMKLTELPFLFSFLFIIILTGNFYPHSQSERSDRISTYDIPLCTEF